MPISITQYLLESSVCLALFYGFYHFLLRRETFFQLNRAYLLLMPLVSLAIPLANIQLSADTPSPAIEAIYPIVVQAQQFQQQTWEQMESPTPAFSLSLADLLLWIYLLGVFFMALVLVRGLWRLFRLIRHSRREQEGALTLLRPAEDLPAASFFSYIFWKGEEMPEAKRIILEHELVHVRQRHSLDVLLMELWVIIKWFNPLIYLYRRSLQATHEYIADRYVAGKMGSAYQYATFLATHSLQGSCHPLTNTFAAYIRKRLAMLGQRDSKWWQAGRYLLCLPLLGMLMALFSFNLSEKLPGRGLRQAESYLQELGRENILELPAPPPAERPQYLDWGGLEIPVVLVEPVQELSPEVVQLRPALFRLLRQARPQLKGSGKTFPVKHINAWMQQEGREELFSQSSGKGMGWMAGYPEEEFSFLLQLTDAWGREALAVFIVSGQEGHAFPDGLSGHILKIMQPVIKQAGGSSFNMATYGPETILGADNLANAQPYYLKWGAQSINLLWVNDPDHGESAFLPTTELSFSTFQELCLVLPELWNNHSPSPVQLLALAVEKDGEGLYTCEERDIGNHTCFEATVTKARPGDHLSLVLKDSRREVYAARIALVEGGGRPAAAGLSAFIREKWAEYSRRAVVEARTPKPLFRHSGKMLRWGDSEAFFVRSEPPDMEKAELSVSLEGLNRMLREDMALFGRGYPIRISRIWLAGLFYPEKKEWEQIMSGSAKEEESNRLDPLQREEVLAKVAEGANRARFAILYDNPENEQQNNLQLDVWIDSAPQEESPLFPEEGVTLNPAGIYPYQYINRPGEKSLIKIDTTVEKYRWMYDNYKDGKTLDVVHIPGFRTVRRAVTLADVILPEPEVGTVELLAQGLLRTEQLSEYHDFSGQKVYLYWRGQAGLAGEGAISLAEFRNARETGLELRVGAKRLPLRQVELLFVPESGPAYKCLTDSVRRPEVQAAIGKLQHRSSVFVTNIVVEGEQGQPLLFPLSFAFNLR